MIMEKGRQYMPKTAYIHDDFESTCNNQRQKINLFPRPRSQVPSHLLFDLERTQISENLAPPKIRKPVFNSRSSTPLLFSAPALRQTSSRSFKFVKRGLDPISRLEKTRPSTDSKLLQLTSSYNLDDAADTGKTPSAFGASARCISSYVPATFKKLPHLMTKIGDDERVIAALSSIQGHGYISKSPVHCKALTLSRRGYVECHNGGLTEIMDVKTLEVHMQKFGMLSKHTIVQRFREFKYLRKWDHALRRRKFNDRRKAIQSLLIQSKRDHWECARKVMVECVQLQDEVRQPPWTVPAVGLTLEGVSLELQRRCDIIVDALEASRSRISEIISAFFTSISSAIQVSRLKKIYRLNRMHRPQEAFTLASKDVDIICRLYCLCEHIICQTAIMLYNEELRGLSLLLGMERQGVLQVEAFMKLDHNQKIPSYLPFSNSDILLASSASQIILIPDGRVVHDTISRDMNALFNSIALSMQPRIVKDLDDYLPSEYLELSFKPDYSHCLMNSYDFITVHSKLKICIMQSHSLALTHCDTCLNHIKALFAYVESFSSLQDSNSAQLQQEQLDSYPRNAEQYLLWREIVVKLPGQESEIGAFRLKYRRFKSYLQEKLQREVIDLSFKRFFTFSNEKILDLKATGVKYLRHLDDEVSSYQQLISYLPFICELEQKIDQYIDEVQAATRMREILQQHYLDTTSGVDGTAKFALPVLNPHLAEQMRARYAEALARVNALHSQHVDTVQAVHSDFLLRFKSFENQLRGPVLRNISSNVPDVKSLIKSLNLEYLEFESKAVEISNIMDLMKLKLMDMDQLSQAKSVLFMLDEVWSEIEIWKSFSTKIMHAPISELQTNSVDDEFVEISIRMKRIISKYDGAELISGLKAQFFDLERQWATIQKVIDPKMKRSHFEVLLNPRKGTLASNIALDRENHIELSQISISDLAKKGVLDDTLRLSNIYALAAKEEAMFGMSERLHRSVENLSICMRGEEGILWLDGFDTTLTQIHDHEEALQWLQESGFAGMVTKELADIGTRNTELQDMLLKLRKCTIFWSKNRCLLRNQYPIDIKTKESFILDTANTKWTRCLKLLAAALPPEVHHNGITSKMWMLKLSKLEPSTVQKVQDALDAWEKTSISWPNVVQQTRNDFPRLYLLDDMEVLEVCSYFTCPGPDINNSSLSVCFSNIQSFVFNSSRVPVGAVGVHGEYLDFVVSSDALEVVSEMQSSLHLTEQKVKTNIKSQILQTVARHQNISEASITSFLFSGIAQAIFVGLQLIWTSLVLKCEAEGTSVVLKELTSILNASVQGIKCSVSYQENNNIFRSRDEWRSEGLAEGSDSASRVQRNRSILLKRSRYQATILLCLKWRDFAHEQTDCFPLYEQRGEDIVVKFGPLMYVYEMEMLSAYDSLAIAPQTTKYFMYIISCLCSRTCGIIFGSKGCGKSDGLSLASRTCGSYIYFYDFLKSDSHPDLQSVVTGSILGGCWLCFQNTEVILEHSICQLAKLIFKTYEKCTSVDFKTASLRLCRWKPVFLLYSAEHFPSTCLPSNLRESTRPFGMVPLDNSVVVEYLLRAHGIMDPSSILSFSRALRNLQLALPTEEATKCLSIKFLNRVFVKVEETFKDRPLQTSGAIFDFDTKVDSDPKIKIIGGLNDPTADTLATFFLELVENQLCHKSYLICEAIISQSLNILRASEAKKQDSGDDPNILERVKSALSSKGFASSPHFVKSCMRLCEIFLNDRRPTIVVGTPQSGKSVSIQISRLAQIIDLTGSAKDFIPNTLIKNLHIDGFSPSLTYFEFWEYVKSISNRNLNEPYLIFDDLWLVLDFEDISFSDVYLQKMLMQEREADFCSSRNSKRPRIILETCSVGNMHPSLLSFSNVFYLEADCISWSTLIEAWKCSVSSKMEDRDVVEIDSLVSGHLSDVLTFILRECTVVANISTVSLTKTFCSILENLFFLGRANALRRAIKFCRSAFIFAVTWSYGALVSFERRKVLTEWVKCRMPSFAMSYVDKRADITLWDLVLSEENMELRVISDKEFEVDTRLQRQLSFAPSREMCMYEYLFSIFKLQKQNMLFIGKHNVGKTFFLDLMDKKMKHENKLAESKFVCNQGTKPAQLIKWFVSTGEQITASAVDRVTLFIDDIHLPKKSDRVQGLLRYAIENKGIMEKNKFHNSKQLSRAILAISCDTSKLNVNPVRLLGSLAVVHMTTYSTESNIQIALTTSDLKGIVTSNSVKSVFMRLPAALTYVYEWVCEHVRPARSEDVFLRWSQVHLQLSVKALSLVTWSDMDGPNVGLSFVWHDLMRIYSDRMTNLQQIEQFRSGLKIKFTESMGRNHARAVNLASEKQAFYVMLPANMLIDSKQAEPSPLTWEFCELSSEKLIEKAKNSIREWNLAQRKVIHIPGFARHLSHALYFLRPSSRVHACILVGPRGSGKRSVLRAASKICSHKAVWSDGTMSVREMNALLKASSPTVIIFSGTTLKIDFELQKYVLKLLKGQNLDGSERAGLSNLRIAFSVETNFAAIQSSLAGLLPSHFHEIVDFCTVDWYEGWTDFAIFNLIESHYTEMCAGRDVFPKPKIFVNAIFQVYMQIELFALDLLEDKDSAVYPLPGAVTDLAARFIESYEMVSQNVFARVHLLKKALHTFKTIREYEHALLVQLEALEPLVHHVTEARVKCREDAARFERIAKRAQEIAESEMVAGLQDVLYGDAPGQDLQQDFQDSKVQLAAAVDLIRALKPAHLTQLETTNSAPDLQELLFESLAVCLGVSELEYVGLKRSASSIPSKIYDLDLEKVSRERIYQLRPFVSNPKFIPEKLFAINRAAGTFCHWVRCFERFTRANEWIKPDSVSNEKQSLERVRGLAKDRLTALEEVQSSVQLSKKKRIDAIQEEASTREQFDVVKKQLERCRVVTAALSGSCASWSVEIHELEKRLATLEGDSLLLAAYDTYLGIFPFEQRRKVIEELQNVLSGQRSTASKMHSIVQPIATSETFLLTAFCSAEFVLKQWEKCGLSQDICSKENAVLALSSTKIPLIIDQHSQISNWLRCAFPDITVFTVVDLGRTENRLEKLRSILQDSHVKEHYVLLADINYYLAELVAVLEMNPSLVPKNAGPFPGAKYRIFLSSSNCDKHFFMQAYQASYFNIMDMTPDKDALESIARCAVLVNYDAVSHSKQAKFVDQNWQIRKSINETEISIFQFLQSENVVETLKFGKDEIVCLCQVLLDARESLQNLVVSSMSSMRSIECYCGLSSLLSRILSTLMGPLKNLLGYNCSTPVLKMIEASSASFLLCAEECWSLNFKNELERLSSFILSSTCKYLQSIRPEQSSLTCFLICVCCDKVDCELTNLALPIILQTVLKTRDHSSQPNPEELGLVESNGWKHLVDLGSTLGIDFKSALDSVNVMLHSRKHQPNLQLQFSNVTQVMDELDLKPIQKFFISCCFFPQYIQVALEKYSTPYINGRLSFKEEYEHKILPPVAFVANIKSLPRNQALRFFLRNYFQNMDGANISTNDLFEIYYDNEIDELIRCRVVEKSFRILEVYRPRTAKDETSLPLMNSKLIGRNTGRCRESCLESYHFIVSQMCWVNWGDFGMKFMKFCEEELHPKDIFESVIADCWLRGLRFGNKFFWRAALGICYFFFILNNQRRLGVPFDVINIEQFRLQHLFQCIRLLDNCDLNTPDHSLICTLSILKLVFSDVFYPANEFGNYVMFSLINRDLFTSENLNFFSRTFDSPDKYISNFKQLLQYSMMLPLTVINLSFLDAPRWSARHEEQLSICDGLKHFGVATPGPGFATPQSSSIKKILEQIPLPLNITSTQVVVYFQMFKSKSQIQEGQLQFLDKLLSEILCDEGRFLNIQIELARKDLFLLSDAMEGKTIFSASDLEILICLTEDKTPLMWTEKCPEMNILTNFLSYIRDKANFIVGMFCKNQEIEMRSKAPIQVAHPKKFPLHLLRTPGKIFEVFRLAHSFAFPVSLDGICFCALPVDLSNFENSTGTSFEDNPFPESGFLISDVQLFGAKFSSVGSIELLSSDTSPSQPLFIKSVQMNCLPFRSQMKAAKNYWIKLPLFPEVPTYSVALGAKATRPTTYLHLISKFNPGKFLAHESCVCLLLGRNITI